MRATSHIVLALVSIVSLFTVASAGVNYTCLADAAIPSSSQQAAAVGACLQKTGDALSATAVKSCLKSTKVKDKTAKKAQGLYYKCLGSYWKAAGSLAKKNSTLTAAVTQCLATTGDYSQCKLATLVGTSNAKLAKKAGKLDAKWSAKKCADVLTPAGCAPIVSGSSTAAPAVNGSTTPGGAAAGTTTTGAAAGTTTTTTTTTTAVAGATTTTTAASTTTPDPCLSDFCLPQCLLPRCTDDVAAAVGQFKGNTLYCNYETTIPTPTTENGAVMMTFNWFSDYCPAGFVHIPSTGYTGDTSVSPFPKPAYICNPGDKLWTDVSDEVDAGTSWEGKTPTIGGIYCLGNSPPS